MSGTISRRGFLLAAGSVAAALPVGAYAEAGKAPLLVGKHDLRVLNDRPLNAETPAHLLDDATTPTASLFVRNNGHPPLVTDAAQWRLHVQGESCVTPTSFTIDDLKGRFEIVSYDLQLECGGNGRAEFRPRASGNQWTTGAIGCPRWTGVRVADVLDYCGLKDDVRYVGFVGADRHLSGDPNKIVISRGVPIHKATEVESLIAFALNGQPIPLLHGAPLRLVCGGWPGSVCGKWLTHLLVRNKVHDGAKMGGNSYRVPCEAVAPGSKVDDPDMCIIESMPVKSLITYPRSGGSVALAQRQILRGQAWAGDLRVKQVQTSIDYGASWQMAELAAPRNRLAWQQWQTTVTFKKRGFYEVWAKAMDEFGRSQPMLVPGWNPKGYLNNATHRIALQVG